MAVRPIDGEALWDKLEDALWYDNYGRDIAEKIVLDMPTLTPPNEPLTIEQLREMDGEPVWVDFTGSTIKRESGWFILKNTQDAEIYLVGQTAVYKGYEYYGKTWIAYRHPPKIQEDTK